jgi:biotin synthase
MNAIPKVTLTLQAVLDLFALPFNELLHHAAWIHRGAFDPNAVQASTLLSIKTGGCSENCGYCAQSAAHGEAKAAKLAAVDEVVAAAQAARDGGSGRFCMGAAWRALKDRDLPRVVEMVKAVHDLGLETCMTLGMLTPEQATALREAGLDYYNHNIDTSEDYYPEVVTTHSFGDRLDTLETARAAGLKLCSGGIVGMGEAREDRAAMLLTLARMDPPPESVPVNLLMPMPGTPLADKAGLDVFELVRTIAVARILMPRSQVRLSAGRTSLSDEAQALCFHAGANSIFIGERLLTAGNPEAERDRALLGRLDMRLEG